MKNLTYAISGLLALFFTVTNQTAHAAPSSNKAIIVLDASKSMKDRVKGEKKTKMEIASGAIDKMLKGWDKKTQLGITAYGHIKGAACNSIETIVPVGKLNRKTVMSAINALKPVGRTPLSAAVRTAADQLNYKKDKATIIVISDGIENCNADPCKIAKTLEKQGIDFTIHVIGFDIKNNQQSQLRCLAKNTGGRFFQAKNSAELNNAMKNTIKTVAQAAPKTESQASGVTGLKLRAALSKGGDPMDNKGVDYFIYEAKKQPDGSRKRINEIYNHGTWQFELPAGKYYVLAEYGKAQGSEEVQLKAGQLTEKTIVLNAGFLKIQAALTKGGDPLDGGLNIYVYNAKKSIDGKRNKIDSNYRGSNYAATLPAGKYYVLAEYGKAQGSAEVQVKANERTEKTIIVTAGALKVQAALTKGGDPLDKGVSFYIYEAKKSIDGKRNKIDSQYDTNYYMQKLPPSKYYIVATYGEAEAAEEVEVKVDELTEKTIIIKAGALKVQAALSKGGNPLDKGVSYDVYEAKKGPDGSRNKIKSVWDKGSYTVKLPQGNYFIEAKYQKVSAGNEVKVKAGELTEKTIVLPKR